MDPVAPVILLRPWSPTDADELVALADDPRVAESLRDRFPHPYTADDARSWLEVCAEQAPTTVFNRAIVVGGALAGGIGLERLTDVHAHTGEIGYWLGTRFWGRGIATAVVMAATRYGFEQMHLQRIQAGVFEWNPASARVLEKAGYALEGRLRRHVVKGSRVGDQLMYARLSGAPYPVPPIATEILDFFE